MYVGGTDERAMHHLAAEVLDNSMDEAVAGHATRIEVTLDVGNRLTIVDNGDGSIGRDWGIYGWPETYVVDGKGIIRLKIVGELTERVVQQQLLPAIEKAKLAS